MGIRRVLVANRGEIAVRIIRACQSLGLGTVLAVSKADRDTLATRLADRVVCVGPARSTESYLNVGVLVTAAVGTQCDALHPGYGFLSEQPELAQACGEQGITFVGPRPESIETMGNKILAREVACKAGVPVLSGSDHVQRYEDATHVADQIGFPLLLKAAAGGGGRGMKVVKKSSELRGAFETASAEALGDFGDDTLYVENYIANARHVEVQVLGDSYGHVIHLGERDCSLQRRHQKVVEEAPATAVPESLRERIREAAVTLADQLGYQSAGTVEFIVDQDRNDFSFLEMNTRIQVEHPVSECITGVDLIQQQLHIA